MRIGGLGVGTFLVLVFGVLYIFLCFVGLTLSHPGPLYLISSCLYACLIFSLLLAKRRDDYSDEVIIETDPMWIVRVSFGFALACSCCVSVVLLIQHSITQVVKGKPIYNELQIPPLQRMF